jgi:hypothetical protein
MGGKIIEFPATLQVRMLGRSKMKILRTIMGHLRLLARLARMRAFGTEQPLTTKVVPAAAPAPAPRLTHV